MRKLVSAIGIFWISLFLLISSITLLVMSVKDYSPLHGLVGSPFVGLDNITEVLSDQDMGRVLKNTLVISVLSLAIGAGYLLAAFESISALKNTISKLVFTFLFALPALIPVNAYTIMLTELLPREVLTNSSILLQVITAAQTGLRFSAVFVIAALFTKDNSRNEVLKNVLLYVAVGLIRILTLDAAFLNGFSNPLTYEHLDTYGTYSYRTGLMQSQFSLYAGRYVVGLLIQLLPAIVGIVLLVMLLKNESHVVKSSRDVNNIDNAKRVSPIVIVVVLPVALLLLVIIAGGGGSLGFEHLLVAQSYARGIIIAAASSIVVVVLGMLLANAALELKAAGICLVAFLYFISDDLLGSYFVIRSLGMYNTFAGMVLQNLHWIAPTALIGAVILRSNYSVKKVLAVSVAALGIGFAWFWGDYMSAMVVASSSERYPISYVMQQAMSGSAEVQLTATLYIIVPVLVAGIGIVVGGLMYQGEKTDPKVYV